MMRVIYLSYPLPLLPAPDNYLKWLNWRENRTIGSFSWDGANFSESAEDVTFSIEGDGQVPVLRALLYNSAGETFPRDVNLAERIENHDGAFVYV